MTPVSFKVWCEVIQAEFDNLHYLVECDCGDGLVKCDYSKAFVDCSLCNGKGSYYQRVADHVEVSEPEFSVLDYRKAVLKQFVILSRWTNKSHYKEAKRFLDSLKNYTGF